MLGVLLVFAEQRQPGFEQRFQISVRRRRDQQIPQRAVDRGMIGDLVRDIGAVECRAVQSGQFVVLLRGLRRQVGAGRIGFRSEEHTSELQSLMRISYAVFCLKKKKKYIYTYSTAQYTVRITIE